MLLWLGFIGCTSLIVYSGAKLSKYGDVLAEKTGLSRTWIGVALMASVTSLPELVTGISSVTYAEAPDIALGDVFGSCVFNLLILAVLDAVHHPLPISSKAHHGHILSAGFGILLLGVSAVGLVLGNRMPAFGRIGLYTVLFIVIYQVAMRLSYRYEKRHISAFIKEVSGEMKYAEITAKKAAVNYGINAALVILAAVFLPKIGQGIAETTGLGQTFVGNIFIALSTSLPEVVVSLSAVRLGVIDLAVGNLFGSNIFNIGLILALDDIFFLKGPILSFAGRGHLISALSAIVMTAVAIIGLIYRTEKKALFLAWDSIAICLVYLVNMLLLYMLR